ncbi:hypothetical protein [Oenococcus sicerae]|uniref:hypothetical protein n=2 Tax=Oenococcus sicerae TaxID=2203724 RepID=UPI0010B7546A|nr:hypothetical protein OAL24_01120 [Oenococcus sicerae]
MNGDSWSWNMMSPFAWIWSLIAFCIQIAILIIIVLIVIAFWKKYQKKDKIEFTHLGSYFRSNEAQRILDEKFARGEISESKYLKRKKLLAWRASDIKDEDIKDAEKTEDELNKPNKNNKNKSN